MSDFSPAEHCDNIVWRTQKFKMFKMLWLYNTCTGHSHQLFLCVFQTQSQVFLGYTYLHWGAFRKQDQRAECSSILYINQVNRYNHVEEVILWLSFFLAVKQLYRPIWLESTSLLAECHQIMFKAEVFLGSFFQKMHKFGL